MKNQDPSAPSEGRHETGPGAAPGSPAQADSVLADIDALALEVESAPRGSTALDQRIHFGFRVAMECCPDIGALMFREGISWDTVKQVLDAQIPLFTTSLDAALEGENITFVVHAIRQGKWGAMQRTRHGEEILAWAATEPLARRLAAIKAWRAQFARAMAEMSFLANTQEENRAELDAPPPSYEAAEAADTTPEAEPPPPAPVEKRRKYEDRPTVAAEEEKKDWEVLF